MVFSLDPSAIFGSLVLKRDYVPHKTCHPFIYETDINKATEWADIILSVAGLTPFICNLRATFLKMARSKGIPFVWMSQSMEDSGKVLKLTKKDLFGTVCVARGNNTANYIKKITGEFPSAVVADLSFLVEPKKWVGKQYVRGYTTYCPPRATSFVADMHKSCNEVSSVQIIWKKKAEIVFEPELSIDSFAGTVEENFGLIASLKEVHTARYQAGCAAILAGIKPNLRITSDKYEDLISFYGLLKEELIKSAMQSCEIAVRIAKEGI